MYHFIHCSKKLEEKSYTIPSFLRIKLIKEFWISKQKEQNEEILILLKVEGTDGGFFEYVQIRVNLSKESLSDKRLYLKQAP